MVRNPQPVVYDPWELLSCVPVWQYPAHVAFVLPATPTRTSSLLHDQTFLIVMSSALANVNSADVGLRDSTEHVLRDRISGSGSPSVPHGSSCPAVPLALPPDLALELIPTCSLRL
ncbi:hypothetical protein ACG7TL_004997 [Trametes sanguinea]